MQQDNLNEVLVTVAGAKTYSKLTGNINDLKDIAVELRKLATEAGSDLSGNLNDALFEIEVQYQAFHGLDEDDFEVVNGEAKEWTIIEHNGVNFNCRVIRDIENPGNTLTVGTTELSLSLQEEFGLDFTGCGVDEQIAYYADENEIELSDKELFNRIYS